MADRVRMIAKSTFANERISVQREDGTEIERGTAVVPEQEFETDLLHAKDLARLKLAEAVNPADLDGDAPLEAHFQVSEPALRADQAKRKARADADAEARQRAADEKAERDRLAEQDRLRADEAERALRAEQDRLKAEEAERAKAEQDRLRAEADAAEKARLAAAEADARAKAKAKPADA